MWRLPPPAGVMHILSKQSAWGLLKWSAGVPLPCISHLIEIDDSAFFFSVFGRLAGGMTPF
jgi:hypothetical protein